MALKQRCSVKDTRRGRKDFQMWRQLMGRKYSSLFTCNIQQEKGLERS